MSLLPSPTAIRHAHLVLHRAQTEKQPHTIVIDNATFTVGGHLGPLLRPFDEAGGGARLVQTFTFSLPTAALATAPTANVTTLTREGLTFTIREVTADQSHSPVWHITATRTARAGES